MRITYSTAWRPTSATHPLIVHDPEYGPVLRFRSMLETNAVSGQLPPGLAEARMYSLVESAISGAVAVVHRWRPGDLLIVDNRAMLHAGAVLRHAPHDPLPVRRSALPNRHNQPMRHLRLPAPALRAIAPVTRLWWRIGKPTTFGVKALLLHPDSSGRFLAVRHSYSDPRRWGLPGGGYKPSRETPEQAIAREVAEELAIAISPDDFRKLDSVSTTLEGKRDTLTTLTATAPAGSFNLSPELAEARWISNTSELGEAPVSRWLIAAVSRTA